MKRTIALKLDITEQEYQTLSEMQTTFAKACNFVSQHSQEKNRIRLHHDTYRPARETIPQIGSQMICNAIAKVSASRKALRKGKTSEFKHTTSVHYDKRTYSLKNGILSLFTLEKRKQFTFQLGPFQEKYLRKGTIKEAELIRKGKRFFFNLVLDLPDPPIKPNGKLIAVDFGENTLAATSEGKLYGGGPLKSRRDQFLGHRKRLQRNGSQSAKQRLRQISGREKRHVRHVNHCIAKDIVEEAHEKGTSTIVLEDLKNIRKRIKAGKKLKTRLHRWPFSQLRLFIEYKAQAKGMQVELVNPAYTSQTCSKCLVLGERQKHRFFCQNCGSLSHSDLNASQNLLRLGLTAVGSTGSVNSRDVAI